MASIRCPNCGKENPESLDRCQFCQSPLESGPSLRIGESPTKKDTGELEPILPDWLKDLRQQARKSAEENAAQEAARLKSHKEEAPDLLAGLASQSSADEDEIPDWLASLGSVNKTKTPEEVPPAQAATDFFAQFDRGESKPAPEDAVEPEIPAASWKGEAEDQPQAQESRDELSEWFSRAAEQPAEPFTVEPGVPEGTPGWTAAGPAEEPGPQKEPEDLSWLHDLEASARQAAETPTPAEPFAPQEDLSWLENLGAVPEPSQPAPPSAPQEDLSWLDNLGSIAETPQAESVPPSPAEDLSWLNELGVTAESSQPQAEEPSETPPASSAVFSPRRTAPLGGEPEAESMPDWLKSATEEPSMPPLGAGALDWLASHEMEKERGPAAEAGPTEAAPPPPFDQAPAFAESGGMASPGESAAGSGQDVDSLFSIEMPDWLSQAGAGEASPREAALPPAEGDETLAPVELPSWVQAMRPVEAVISETGPGAADQPPESEGPLAGLSGVIPLVPIGSSQRPKAISLKLQATNEQQASAALLEQMLAAETSPRQPANPPLVMSQRALRWVLAGLVVLVLGAMVALRSRSLPVPASLPVEVGAVSSVVAGMPASPTPAVLVIIDYDPALAAEMEALSGPVLNQIAMLRRAVFSFVSTSPNGPALVEHLMASTEINRPAPEGLGYLPGEHYRNLGYLPGGHAGVLTFIASPQTAIPGAGLESLSGYAAVILLTDRAESGRIWIEQLQARRQVDPALASQPVLLVASAQAGPLLQPYAASQQVSGMISGLSDAAGYEFVNNVPPGIARGYWDTFDVGLLMAILLITVGSLWNLFTAFRARRLQAEGG